MAKRLRTALTARDLEVLSALDRQAMTASQLQLASRSFSQPYPSEALVRRRLGRLRSENLVKAFPYSVVSEGRAPHYWKLTPNGYRLLYGPDVALPSPRFFRETSLGMHTHAFALAEIVAHLMACGAEHGVTMDQFARENSFALSAGGYTLRPDAGFQLSSRSDKRPYSFLLEVDNGTERVRTTKDVESIERKIRGYDAHQSRYHRDDPARYIVIVVTTRSEQRLDGILGACDRLIRNPDRTLFIGATLEELQNSDPFEDAVFRSNNGLRRTIIPRQVTTQNVNSNLATIA